ncbi:cysteine dioxygenase [Polaribacter sp. KT25b]|uniref:cysteine dioxygenase n=1 Tax=Polaribacter sp. KT25b TaxID=1855336 RepID=UPI00087ADC73|nr:cysteine dioxygenase family protein [Polaribacter sp. KT25b]SDR67213.1 cysteine dioxygenase [Polaribacter sp. KT25b]
MKIKTIEKLILALNTCAISNTESCYLNALKKISIPLKEWEKYFKFKEYRPGRVSLFKNKRYQLVLSCWEKGQQSPIHDIDSKEAWIHPISGQFIEERYRISKEKKGLEQVSSILMNSLSYSYMQKSKTIYRYINSFEHRSACLHLYSKPVLERKEYDKNTGRVSIVKQLYDMQVKEYNHLNN